jgi:hypothetical protein
VVGPVRTLTRLGISAAAITLVNFSAMTLAVETAVAAPDSSGPTRVGLRGALKNCDFSIVNNAPVVPFVTMGTGVALISRSGSTAVAEVHIVNTAEPGMHFDAGLIQTPRPSSATCGPGDPGTSWTGLDLDAGGQGTVTIQSPLQSGTTGVWVLVQRPNPHSQAPAEFYTSEFVAPV